MSDKNTKELKVKEKQALSSSAEQTKPGRLFTPSVDIFEDDKAITLLADMPGVKSDAVQIDLKDYTLTLNGAIKKDRKEDNQVFMEYETGNYYRQFSIPEVIDQEKIDAKMKDGVLRLTLPKLEKATPRKITVQAVS